ncbi:bifunctional class I SAM-dependent methyltransferase/glycosyltransferase [Mangrovibacter sp. MFB070]|uniref:bifunctional class I SAM-dependent methyltransferase/glycosyltransferase n=1 Tax=Mangrovibacter sp. MFB070 TaxID=1224318 RepID=UPI001362EF07|nr:bifunctional class I SAM-dependent methyltransferase/glycosyltransferase [Mangrovibacter sp. MFB070]
MHNAVNKGSGTSMLELSCAPDYIGSVAWLYGFDAVAPVNARVLELGCGDGAWLASQAARWPESSWVGVELSCENLNTSQTQILTRMGGPANLSICSASLEELLSTDIGQFDYIIIHGTFSLLSNQRIDQVLAYCQMHLASQGLITHAWSCNPGAKNQEVIRDAVQMHAAMATNASQQQDCMHAMLAWFSMTSSSTTLGQDVEDALQAAKHHSDKMLVDHYLLGQNEGQYFLEYHGRVTQMGLGYVGDLAPWTELPEHYGSQTAQMLSAICPQPHKILSQQYLDFACQRSKRYSVLGHRSQTEGMAVFPDKARLMEMRWAGSFRRIMEGYDVCTAVRIHDDTPITINDENTLSVLDIMGEAWPLSITLEQVWQQIRLPDVPEDNPLYIHRENLGRSLNALFEKGVPGLHFRRPGFEPKPLTKTAQLAVVPGWQNPLPINMWNEPVSLTEDERSWLAEGDLSVTAQSASLHDALRYKGIFSAQPFAWQRYLQSLLAVSDDMHRIRMVSAIILFSAAPEQGGFLDEAQQKLSRENPRAVQPDLQPVAPATEKKAKALVDAGQFVQAEQLYLSLVEDNPNKVHALYLLEDFYLRTFNKEPGFNAVYRAIAMQPASWKLYADLGIFLVRRKNYWLCGRIMRAVLRNNKRSISAWDLLGKLHSLVNRSDLANYCYEQALALDDKNETIYVNKASVSTSVLKTEEAIALLRKALELNKYNFDTWTSLLFELAHRAEVSPGELYKTHLSYGQHVYDWMRKQNIKPESHSAHPQHERLRVGFVSGDFRKHPVAYFLLPFWESLDRSKFDVYAYNTSPHQDEMTDRLATGTVAFRSVIKNSHRELAEIIKNDEIDILIDLSGHTAFNRLPVFAMRPAPVQMTWIGYPGTSGLKEIDYRIISPGIAPAGFLDSQFTEKLLYVPFPTQFTPELDSPAVSEPPFARNGFFTFASFNRPMKLSQPVIACWAGILKAAPDSKMLIAFMSGQSMIDDFTQRFMREGVNPSQLVFREKVPMKEFLAMHSEVDLLLDAFPYTGGTTTNHAAWMGVPTLTLAGETMAARQGVDIMQGYHLQSFIADSVDDYQKKALEWKGRTNELARLRRELRERVWALSQQRHETGVMLGEVLNQVWQLYRQGVPAHSFTFSELIAAPTL